MLDFAYSTGFDYSSRKGRAAKSKALDGKSRRARMWSIFGISILWTGALLARLFSLQIANFETWQDWALRQHFAEVKLASERGPVFDRNGKLMAVSVPAGSVYVRPKQVKDKKNASVELAALLGLKSKDVMEDLNQDKPFVWVERQIPRSYAEKVEALKIPGAGFLMESRRFYPYNQAASPLIGKVGVDGIGLSGIESVYESVLKGEQRKTKLTKDAFGNMIDVGLTQEDFELPKGNAVRLTIDSSLQIITDEETEAGRIANNAQAAMAVMMDADTGEILAMSQSPAVNFNNAKMTSKKDLKNLLVETVFEPGSIMKPIVAAAALEEKVTNPNELINCEHGHFFYASHTIKDAHPVDTVSFHDVVVRSSNIGMTKVGSRLGAERLYSYLQRFGFGQASSLGLPGETKGILRPVSEWAKVDVATHSFGQGVAVTPLQMVRAVASIANGGKLPTLRVVDDGKPYELKRVVSEKSAAQVQDMLYGVVEDEHGTGNKAMIPGVRIGGKTGTAQKPRADGKGYKPGAYMASFVGFADATALGIQKKIVLAVIVDEAHTNSIYGGTISAPIFKRIMQRTLHTLSTQTEIEEGSEEAAPQKRPEVMARLDGFFPVGLNY